MTHRAQMLILSVLSACTKQPQDHTQARSQPSHEPELVQVAPASDSEGVVTASVAPSGDRTLRVTASATSAVPTASVTYQPGTLAASGTVTIEESSPVVSDHLLTLIAGVDASAVSTSAAAVKIDIEPPADPLAPMEIRIPAPAAAGLQDTPGTLAVIYHAKQHVDGGKIFSGILFADSLTLEGGVVSFKFGNYGAFQAVHLAAPEALKSAATVAREVTAPPLGKKAQGALAAFEWGTLEALKNDQRNVVVSFAGQSGKVSDCSVHVDDDQARPFLASLYFGAKSFATVAVPGEGALTVFARITCFDAAGRVVVSPWSDAIELTDAPAVAPASPAPSPAPPAGPEPSPAVLADETPPVPAAQGALTVGSATAFSSKLTWAKAEDDVSPQAKLVYRIYRSSSNDITTLADAKKNGVAVGTSVVDGETATVGGLSEATTYWLNVVVQDEAGNEAAYAATQLTTADASPPVPGNKGALTLGTATASQVEVSWTAATDKVTAAAALRYRLFYSTSNNIGSVSTLKANGTAVGTDFETAITSKTLSGLSEATSYYLNVLVKDEAGREAVYAPVAAKTLDVTAPVPGASGALTSGTISSSSIEVRWVAATDNSGASGITYSLYQASTSGLGTLDAVVANGSLVGTAFTAGTARTAAGLSELRTYYFNVVAKDAAGNKALYAQTSFTTSDVSAPTPGGSGTITTRDVQGTTLNLSWTAAADNGTASSSLRYSVYRAASSDAAFDTVAAVKAGSLFGTADQAGLVTQLVTGLTSSTSYKFNILVKDAQGNEAVYDPVEVTTADTTPPAVDSNLITLVSYTAKTATLQWTAASDATTADPSLLTYRVHHLTTNGFDTVSNVIAAPSSMTAAVAGITSKEVTGLSPGTTYYFNVVVYDEAGNAEKYATLQHTMPLLLGNAVQPATPTLTHVKTVAGTGTAGSVDATDALAATIQSVTAMTTDGVDVFFAQADGKIRKLSTSAASVTTVATVTAPQGLTSDGNYLYVSTGHAIRRIRLSDNNASSVVAGSEGTGGMLDDDGTSARFDTPKALAADSTYLYIWDHTNSLIRKMTLAEPYTVTSVAGVYNTALVDDTADSFADVVAMTIPKDTLGMLYVVEHGHCIRQVATSGGATVSKAGSCADPAADVDAAGTAARFNTPAGIVSTGSTLYVADSLNHAIRAIENLAAGHDVTTLSGTGGSGTAGNVTVSAATWNTPTVMTSTINGIYVYDSANNVIRRIGLP
jgi:hypothetical protein